MRQGLLLPILRLRPVLDVQTPRLIIRAVGRGGDLSVPLQRGHPRLDVKLAIGGRAEVLGGHVEHLEVESELGVHLLLDGDEFVVQRLGLFRGGDNEHLHLAELVQAVHASRGGARGARLSAEAVRKRRHLDGELLLRHHLVHVHTPEENLRRARQAQIAVFDVVHLRVLRAGLEPALLHGGLPHEIGNHHGLEPLGHNLRHGPVDERQLEHGADAGEVHEPRTAHLPARLEVEHAEAFADVHVRRRLEAEVALGAHLATQHRHLLAAEGHLGVRVVRDLLTLHLKLHLERVEIALDGGELVLEILTLGDERGANVGLELALHGLGVGVALLANLIHLAVERLVPIVEVHHLGDVAGSRALVRVGLDRLGVLLDALEVDGGLPRERGLSGGA